jgi:hypothetical protein
MVKGSSMIYTDTTLTEKTAVLKTALNKAEALLVKLTHKP